MSTPGYKSTRRQKRRFPTGLLVAGAGLILLGVVAYGLLIESNVTEGIGNIGFGAPAQVNFSAPDLRLTNLEGGSAALSDYRGKVVLINNWATWCPPCEAEMPTLQAYYQTHQDKDFALIAIDAGESAAEISPFRERYGLTFEIWLDPNLLAIAAFRNTGLPSTYVVDKTGTVRYAWAGAVSREALETYVTPLMEE